MDVEFWASRVYSAKNFSAVQSAPLNDSDGHLITSDMGDDDVRAWFPCPFCYVDIELPAFCLHLQEEHCFDLKNAVCPICAANLGKDAIGHFTTQHAHSVKRRRKSQKSGLWNNSSMVLGKDMREVNSYLGLDPMNGRANMHENAPDPLLSPFLCSIPPSDPKRNRDAEITCNAASVTSEAIRFMPCISGFLAILCERTGVVHIINTKQEFSTVLYQTLNHGTKSDVLDEAQEQDYNEKRKRAEFAQQLILSTIF